MNTYLGIANVCKNATIGSDCFVRHIKTRRIIKNGAQVAENDHIKRDNLGIRVKSASGRLR